MSSPSSRMRPADGRSTPVSRLITVVLPAPFGPIRAWRGPRPLFFRNPPTPPPGPTFAGGGGRPPPLLRPPPPPPLRRRGGVGGGGPGRAAARDPPGGRAPPAGPDADALAADQHDEDQHQPNPELPILRGEGGD